MLPVGIDLGTTLTTIATITDEGKWWCIPNAHGHIATPSVVQFRDNTVCVGQEALNTAHLYPQDTVSEFKRHMGDSEWWWWTAQKEYSATDLSAMVMDSVVKQASQRLSSPIKEVVLAVPAHFGDLQRQATLEAAKQANLHVLRLINEPTAASLPVGYQDLEDGDVLLVADLGGGTFDISALLWENQNLQTLATRGDGFLGGQDWDDLIVHQAALSFLSQFGMDPLNSPETCRLLQVRARQAKHELSLSENTNLYFSMEGQSLAFPLSRGLLLSWSKPLLERITGLFEMIQRDIHPHVPKRIQLVGGGSSMPWILDLVTNLFPSTTLLREKPCEVVALGAAYQAQLLIEKPKQLSVTSKSLVPNEAEANRLPGATRTATEKHLSPTDLRDVNTHTLGLVVLDSQGNRLAKPILPAFTPLPARREFTFYTAYNNQVSLQLELVEGESLFPDDCLPVGTFEIEQLPPRPAGQAIVVTFHYNPSGNLSIEVHDVGLGTRQVLSRTISLD